MTEEHLGVLAVRASAPPVAVTEVARRPLPDVAEHPERAARRGALRVRARRRGAEQAVVEVRVVLLRRLVAPWIGAGRTGVLVPGRRLLPLRLGGEPCPVCSGEG